MILYFSGTGNSEYAAKRLGEALGDEVVNLFSPIKTEDHSPLHSERPWVVVAPTYAWRIPRILHRWLEQTPLTGSREIFFVLTCGGNMGHAQRYLLPLCRSKGLEFSGCAPIVMPENYIALFSTPSREEALATIRRAEGELDRVAGWLRAGAPFPDPSPTLADRLNSGPVNALFYPLFVHAKKFEVTDACTSCGACVPLCPLSNITMADGKPVWGKDCTHCMACICRCPAQAIEYGAHSKGLPRYVCPTS